MSELDKHFDEIRNPRRMTKLSMLPTESLVFQARSHTDPMVLELAERLEDALNHIDSLYYEIDQIEEHLSAALGAVGEPFVESLALEEQIDRLTDCYLSLQVHINGDHARR